jgi:Potential Monad-binding region of RPAP3
MLALAGIEFEAGWKGLSSGHLRSAYLMLIEPSSLPTLLKCNLTTPLLMDLLSTTLENTVQDAPDHAGKLLENFCKVRMSSACSPWV